MVSGVAWNPPPPSPGSELPAPFAAMDGPGGLAAETSSTGSFTNTVAIEVPSFHGIEPGVALNYDSATGNGEVGVGRRLSVGSVIVRAGPHGGLPRYDDTDVFLVDGEQLVGCAPTCRTGGTHETRVQSFERFVFDGTTWTRWHRDGVRLVYEVPNEDPTTAYQWFLAQVVDTHGNTVNYHQDCPNHCFTDLITYGAATSGCGGPGQPSCKAGAAIRFSYQQRPDIVTYPTGKGARQMRQRLRTITVSMDDHLVTAYALSYANNPSTGNSVLRSVRQFPSDADVSSDGTVTEGAKPGATPALPAITFTTPSMSAPKPTWTIGGASGKTIVSPPGKREYPLVETSIPGRVDRFSIDGDDDTPRIPVYGDFDGDGRVDVASGTKAGTCLVRLAIDPHATVKSSSGGCSENAYVIDLNGDGADDLLTMAAAGSVRRHLSKRDGTFVLDVKPAGGFSPDARQCATGDLNGDDLGDLACIYHKRGTAPQLGTLRSTPDGSMASLNVPLPLEITSLGGRVLLATGDVDASTTSDVLIAVSYPGGTWSIFVGYTAPDGSVTSWVTTPTTWQRSTDSPLSMWRLSPADINGDTRVDAVLEQTGLTSSVYVATSEKGSPLLRARDQPIVTNAQNIALGDADGDGWDDILTGSPVGMLRSKGDGNFSTHQPFESSGTCPLLDDASGESLSPVASTGDQNGDGQADLLCATFVATQGVQPRFDLWVQPSPVSPPAAHRWTAIDKNGDGRQDLVAVHYLNPGYQVYTQLAQQDGDYTQESAAVTQAAPGGPPLNNPDGASWIPADVGGLDGVPDGKTDLVLLSGRPGAEVQVTTLLSTETGWTLRCGKPLCVTGASIPDGTDTRAWRPAELNGDNKTDLAHFRFLDPGVRIEYLLSHGDGTWTTGHSDHFPPPAPSDHVQPPAPNGEPLTREDVGSFRDLELNRDGFRDFVHIEVGGGPSTSYITIRSLISTGPTAWREETWQSHQSIDSAAAHRLQPMDFDGDGVTDLGRALVDAGCVRVEAYRHGLTGWSTVSGGAPTGCQPPASLEDLRNLVLDDVNGDGRTDVRHLSRTGSGSNATSAIFTLLNPGDPASTQHWTPVVQTALRDLGPDTWAWTALDTDHDGVAELAHVSWPGVTTLRWTDADDKLSEIDNGRGAKTSIRYRTQPGARTYLPVGMLPIVVDQITVSDTAYAPPVQATAAFTYEGAHWSIGYRQLAGYQTIHSMQGRTTIVTGNDLTDECGARRSSTSTLDTATSGIITKTSIDFPSPGTAAPFTCLPREIHQAECELTARCLIKDTAYAYDTYGNTETVEESAGDLHRRTYSPVHPNTSDYVVDRPYKREVLIPDPAAPQSGTRLPQAKTLFGYDDDTFEHAPHAHGDLTRVTAFSDLTTDTASETFNQYDDAGNLTRTDRPSGWTTTIYDPQRSIFPVSTCDAVGCTTTVWDEMLGVPLTTTDPNQETTSTEYDAFGRPTETTRPDHSTTTLRYLATGIVTGDDTSRQRIRTEVSDGSPGDGVHWHEDLIDGLGRTYRTRDEGITSSSDAVIVADTQYADASDRPAAASLAHTAGQAVRWTTYSYDSAHRLTGTIQPGSDLTQTRRVFSVGAVEDYNELNQFTTSYHDAFGHATQIDEHVRPCASCPVETQVTGYTYDALDNVVTTTDDKGHVTTSSRDALGRETSVTDPDRGTRTRVWRADGNLDSEHDTNGDHAWTYDSIGRPKTRTDTGTASTQTIRWDYDRDPTTHQTMGASIGRTAQVTYATAGSEGDVSGTYRLWYDQMGRTVQARHCIETVCHDMGYAYDPAGRIKHLRYPKQDDPDGELVPYTYDPAGNLTSVGEYLKDIHHDPHGQPTQQTYGNGLIEQFSYDADRLWLDTQTLAKTPKPVHPLYAATYIHDPTGRITQATTANPTGTTTQPVTETYTYDELGRVNSYGRSDRPSLLPERYEYDALGRITKSPTAGTYDYDDPAHPHAVTSTTAGHSRTYDVAGNLSRLTDPTGRSLKITSTPQGMPQTIANGQGHTTMAYGADGQRVKRDSIGTTNTTTYYFDRYVEQNGDDLTKYYWAGDQLIARRAADGSVSYLLQDRVHSTRVVTDQNQNVTARHNYGPYGAPWTDNQTDGTQQRWQGKRTDDDSGLDYKNARYYDPELGQFTTADSIIPNLYQPQSHNRYAFTNGDGGINTWDPTGHMSMRVELKKEQEHQGLRYGMMYAGALLLGCLDSKQGCPAALLPDVTRYHEEVCLSCSSPSEWKPYPGETEPTTPPLIAAGDPTPSDPAEWAPWLGTPSDPPLISAPRTRRISTISNPAEWAPWPGYTSAPPLARGWAAGIEFDLAAILPILSGGGGIAGVNIQYTSEEGLGFYWVYPSKNPSYGFALGASVQIVGGWGSGSWEGPFNSVGASGGPFGGAAFTSPTLPGWEGFQAGLSGGAPIGLYATQTIYKRWRW